MSLHPQQRNTHPMATGPAYRQWCMDQIEAQGDAQHLAWVRAGRPRPDCKKNKWAEDKRISTP
jgi:hypothetical protein